MLAIAITACAAPANAARLYLFKIPTKPVDEALIDFAIQSGISIGGSVRCVGNSQPLVGTFSIDAGLARLLTSTSCGFNLIAPDTVSIVARPRSAASTSSAPPPSAALRDVGTIEPTPLAEVVVTATRRSSVSARMAESISAVGAGDLRDAGATDASQLGSWLSGLTTTNLGPGRDKILLRGLSDGAFTGQTASTVGIYLDDIPITFNAPDPDLRLADVQDVEVLRGPQGFLYGGGSLSGIYRIVTQKPVLNERFGSVLIGGALTDAGAPSGEIEGMANLPLVPDAAAIRLVAYDENVGGYIDNVALHQADTGGSTRGGGRAALRVLLGSAWTATLSGAYQRITTSDTQFITPSLGRFRVANEVDDSSEDAFGEGALTLERTGPWGSFKTTTAVISHVFTSESDASTALALFGAKSAKVGAYYEPTIIDMVAEDVVLSSPDLGRFQWLAGAFLAQSREINRPEVLTQGSGLSPGEDLYSEYRVSDLSRLAFYGQASYALTDLVTAEAGVRESYSSLKEDSDVSAPQTNRQRLFSGQNNSENMSPKISIKFQASANVMAYALASEGHRSGGFNTAGPIGATFVSDGPAVHRQFEPDELWNFEVGVKATALGGKASIQSAVFYDTWEDIQTDQFLPSGLPYTANAGDGRNIGFETELRFRATDRLTFQASTLMDAPDLVRAAPGFSSHDGLPGVPDFSGGAQVIYAWPLSGTLSAELIGETQYVGRSRLTFASAPSPEMGGYELSQISAQIKGSGWRFSVFLANPSNARDNTFSYGDPFNFRQIAETTPQRPRTIRVTLGADF